MTISNFLNPIEEVEAKEEEDGHTVNEEEILQEVIHEHLGLQSTQNDEDEDEQTVKPTFTVGDARQALQVLIEFTEGQDSLSTTYLWALEHLESEIVAIQEASLVQGTLDTWLT